MYRLKVASFILLYILAAASQILQAEENTTIANNDVVQDEIVVKDANHTSSFERIEKYPKENFEIIYMKLLAELSSNDTTKKLVLTMKSSESSDPVGPMGPCLMKTYGTFMGHCYFVYVVGGLERFKQLFLQACKADWLNSDKISDALVTVCKDHKRGIL